MPEGVDKKGDAEQRESDRIIEEVLLTHTEERSSGQLREPRSKKREYAERDETTAEVDGGACNCCLLHDGPPEG